MKELKLPRPDQPAAPQPCGPDCGPDCGLSCGPSGGQADDAPCCGPPPAPASGEFERPGYAIRHFVDGFVSAPAGAVPRVRTRPQLADRLGALMVRVGISRMRCAVAPGLYCVGRPDRSSPVLATANYKLSFDALRLALDGLDAWLLVLDTRGVNVWCAAGKKTFSTAELARRVQAARLAEVVDRREIILPQLAATGVAAHALRGACGFTAIWGPVRAADLPAFLAAGKQASEPMRRVSFSLAERLVLAPVELSLALRPLALALLAALFLAGTGAGIAAALGPAPFSLAAVGERGALLGLALLLGALCGGLGLPALLPWLPGRAFSVKAGLLGLGAGAILAGLAPAPGLDRLALLLTVAATASWLGMNFTGCTPYTSPSGVEKEMRRAMPAQAAALLAAAAAVLAGPLL